MMKADRVAKDAETLPVVPLAPVVKIIRGKPMANIWNVDIMEYPIHFDS